MKISDISVEDTVKQVETFLEEDTLLAPEMKSTLHTLLLLVKLSVNRLGLNSINSHKRPSSNPNRKKKKKKNGNKPGGQNGRRGTNLKSLDNPDEILKISVDKNTLPKGPYRLIGYSTRQVIDLRITRHVIEYQTEIWENAKGQQYVAPFPEGVTRPVQYGQALKAHAVYQSQFQLLPYNRVNDYFNNEIQVPVSAGSLYNFNKEVYDLLEQFDSFVKQKLIQSPLLHVDETGVNAVAPGASIVFRVSQ